MGPQPMTAAELLRALRARGYKLRAEGSVLRITGPRAPTNEERAMATLRAAKADLLEVLTVEQHPAVQAAIEVFPGARLVDVRRKGGGS